MKRTATIIATLATLAAGASPAAAYQRVDPRKSADVSVVIKPFGGGNYAHLDRSVCRQTRGSISDFDAYTLRGGHLGDSKLGYDRRNRDLYSYYPVTVRVYVWCG